jgi:hypothetical protein
MVGVVLQDVVYLMIENIKAFPFIQKRERAIVVFIRYINLKIMIISEEFLSAI